MGLGKNPGKIYSFFTNFASGKSEWEEDKGKLYRDN